MLLDSGGEEEEQRRCLGDGVDGSTMSTNGTASNLQSQMNVFVVLGHSQANICSRVHFLSFWLEQVVACSADVGE